MSLDEMLQPLIWSLLHNVMQVITSPEYCDPGDMIEHA